MRTITYSLLAIIIFGMVTAGYLRTPRTKVILIEARGKNISPQILSESANIMSNRLKDFSDKKFVISLVPGSSQIKVTLAQSWDLKIADQLLTQKGQIAFYETYNRKELSELLADKGRLFSMLDQDSTFDWAPVIGYTPDTGKIDRYLRTLTIGKKCKFAWNTSGGESKISLYALRLNDSTGALLTGADLGNMKFEKSQHPKGCYIAIDFKKTAANKWADATRRNIGRPIAMVIDDIVVSAPVVQEEIKGGSCQITGNYSENEVKYFAAIGNNGELPVGFRIIR